jgi:hypothetical protein
MKITLLNPYFGKWPAWFDAFLLSCKFNPEIDWLFFTDCPVPEEFPDNVLFIPFTLEQFNQLASDKLNLTIRVQNPYKICDIRPAFGLIFDDYLEGVDFWGHSDLDVIWGNLMDFIPAGILETHDIFSPRKEKLCGHFTLYRNTSKVNNLFRGADNFPEIFSSEKFFGFNENGMHPLVARAIAEDGLLVHWPRHLFNFANPKGETPSRLGMHTNHWQWKNGRMIENGQEVMYLHFMTWKKSLRSSNFSYGDAPNSFYVSYSHISTKMESGSFQSWQVAVRETALRFAKRLGARTLRIHR